MKTILLFIGLLLCMPVLANRAVNLYMWSNYIPQSVINDFEKQTGITVHVSTYDNNETLYAKLKADPHIGYDVIIPSSDYVQRMREQGMLRPLDKSQLSNLHYLRVSLLNKTYDPHNMYSLPFVWGSTGILVNKKFWDPATIKSWSDLWQPRFADQLLLLDDLREVFAIGLIKAHDSINTGDPKKIQAAFKALRDLMSNIKVFNSDAIINIYTDEDISIGMCWSGEAFLASQANSDLVYIYPQDGFSLWIDCLAVPKYAPHYADALKLINFILEPTVAKKIMLANGYALANAAAIKMMPAQYRRNPIFNPPDNVIQRGVVQLDVGSALVWYEQYWQKLKLGISG